LAPQRPKSTKTMDESAKVPTTPTEFGLVCDAGSSDAGIHGLTDLFKYAGQIAAKRQRAGEPPAVRVTHWCFDDGELEPRCTYDTRAGTRRSPAVLVLPGNVAAPDTDESPSVIAWLRQKHSEGTALAAVCGGVFILAQTGLLDGRQATTHWSFAESFAERFPNVLTETDRMVIDYGDVVTAGGVLAWADLGLRLTERLLGPIVMLETARYMNVDPPKREQRLYCDFVPRTKHGDGAILAAQQWLSSNRQRDVALSDAARHVALEPRTFLRRFVKATGMKPLEYQQRLRMSRARELLEFSRSSIDVVAARVGYADVAAFRRVFRKVIGLNPSEYRRRFATVSSMDS
jgi:transcriptional regulator GlxA family with amidase domain